MAILTAGMGLPGPLGGITLDKMSRIPVHAIQGASGCSEARRFADPKKIRSGVIYSVSTHAPRGLLDLVC